VIFTDVPAVLGLGKRLDWRRKRSIWGGQLGGSKTSVLAQVVALGSPRCELQWSKGRADRVRMALIQESSRAGPAGITEGANH
jgi:hypothetical protein